MTKQTERWKIFLGKDIPSSLELYPTLFNYLTNSSRILDIGCGFGKTVIELYLKGYIDVFGIDNSEGGIQAANQTAQELELDGLKNHFRVGDAMSLPYDDADFDCVITQAFWTSIMQDERGNIIREVRRVLKSNGIVYMAIWDQAWDIPLYNERYLQGIMNGLEKGSFEVKDKNTGQVLYVAHHYTLEEIRALLGIVKMDIIEYELTQAKTQSGNLIGCHIIIAGPNGQSS